MMKLDEVRFRLLRNDEVPATNPFNLAYRFGLQDKNKTLSKEYAFRTAHLPSTSP